MMMVPTASLVRLENADRHQRHEHEDDPPGQNATTLASAAPHQAQARKPCTLVNWASGSGSPRATIMAHPGIISSSARRAGHRSGQALLNWAASQYSTSITS